MEKETLRWLLSTIAQSYAAIWGGLGMLTVYRFGQLSRDRAECKARAVKPMNIIFSMVGLDALDFQSLSPEAMAEVWESHRSIHEKLKGTNFSWYDAEVEIARIKRSANWSTLIRYLFAYFTGYHLLLVISGILGISFARELFYIAEGGK